MQREEDPGNCTDRGRPPGAVLYGKFSYTKETHEAQLGSLEMSFKEKQTVNIPAWAGVAAIAAGAGLLLLRPKG